jgi:teichuronic acid biosynthesis glycosyltransferase TuaG
VVASFEDKRIRYFSGEHTGLPAISRNIGIQLCGPTEFICFCDDDDVWHPKKIAMQVKLATEQRCYIISTDVWLMDERDSRIERRRNDLLSRFVRCSPCYLFFTNHMCLSSIMWKKELLLTVRFDESAHMRGSEDYLVLLQCVSRHGSKIGHVFEELVGYRRHSGNISHCKVDGYNRSIYCLGKVWDDTNHLGKIAITIGANIYRIKRFLAGMTAR